MIENPESHGQVVAALWGTLPHENGESRGGEETRHFGGPLTAGGALSAAATSFARGFEADLFLYKGVSGTEDFFEACDIGELSLDTDLLI